ncbi:MAG: SAM-dependent chlorinase/fluorinase [Candidatus Hydrogenedentes bacterium]|nr:SAM-dependent chlorinase/fluorinase [Candidatus Hydrogenedentota bacterium]
MPPLVTLTTDFGTRDPYVASMKGVIHSRCAHAAIADLSHEIPPQDVFEGALFIAQASKWFPPGTVHCVVVDPGVGTARLPIAARARGQIFVCPDNGLLTFVTRESPLDEVRIITNKQFMHATISQTFHGRDIFAPAAASLADGAAFEGMGERLNALTLLEIPELRRDRPGVIGGIVMHVDRFGNAITNIHRSDLPDRRDIQVHFNSEVIESISEAYGDVAVGATVALFGSSDYLEIAVHRGDASKHFDLRRGSRVEVRS